MMTKERKTYDREFKRKAVELSYARGNAKEIAHELGIIPELLYRWLKEGPSSRWQESEKLLIDIMGVHKYSHKSYGSPRITAQLREQGWTVSVNRVARVMKAAGISARKLRRFVTTTDSNHNYPIAPNLLKQVFIANRPGQVWVSDITYIRTLSGWLYLTVIIDLFDRKVIGWSMSQGLSAAETIISAWRMAIKNRPVRQELIFHSDRGVQYACNEFVTILRANPLITRSMSRKGNCWDNAVSESFFKTIKTEWIYEQSFLNQEQAQLSVFEWIEGWYNRRRRHSALGYKTIEEFERSNPLFLNQCIA